MAIPVEEIPTYVTDSLKEAALKPAVVLGNVPSATGTVARAQRPYNYYIKPTDMNFKRPELSAADQFRYGRTRKARDAADAARENRIKEIDKLLPGLNDRIAMYNKPEDIAELERLTAEHNELIERNNVMPDNEWKYLGQLIDYGQKLSSKQRAKIEAFRQYHIDNVPVDQWPEDLRKSVNADEIRSSQQAKALKKAWDALKTNEEKADYFLQNLLNVEVPDYVITDLLAKNGMLMELVLERYENGR